MNDTSESKQIESFRASLEANYEWPCHFPFKFIVPMEQKKAILDLFSDDPVQARESANGRYIAYTMELYMHSSDEVISIYQRAANVPDIISL